MSEARTSRLEEDVGEIRAAIVRLEPLINRIDAVQPHLASKEELADPGAWSTPAKSAESAARHEAAKQTVEDLYERYTA